MSLTGFKQGATVLCLGVDFRSYIQGCMDMTAVLIAVVGNRWQRRSWMSWLGRRTSTTNDPVLTEIELALLTGTSISPVLVDGARCRGPAICHRHCEISTR